MAGILSLTSVPKHRWRVRAAAERAARWGRPSEDSRRWPLYVCAILVAWAAAAVYLHYSLIDPWGDGEGGFGLFAGGFDVAVYRDGAQRFLDRGPLYSERLAHALYYLYPPFSALIFVPLTMVSVDTAHFLWFAFSVALLLACVARCFRALGYRPSVGLLTAVVSVTAAASFLVPIRTTLFYGQVNILLLSLVVFDLTTRRTDVRGIGVGLAVGIKLTPGFFIFHYLALRNLRAAVTAVATFATTVAVSWLLTPAESKRYWFHEMTDSTRIAGDLHPGNQSLRGVVARLTVNDTVPMLQWLPLAVVVGIVGLYYAARLHRRGDVLPAIALTGMTSCMVSPFSWGHHWVWMVPLLVHLVHLARQNPRWWLACGLVFTLAGSWVQQFPNINAVGLYLFASPWLAVDVKVLSNLFPWAYLIFLLSVIWACHHAGPKQAEPQSAGARRATDRAAPTTGIPFQGSTPPGA